MSLIELGILLTVGIGFFVLVDGLVMLLVEKFNISEGWMKLSMGFFMSGVGLIVIHFGLLGFSINFA